MPRASQTYTQSQQPGYYSNEGTGNVKFCLRTQIKLTTCCIYRKMFHRTSENLTSQKQMSFVRWYMNSVKFSHVNKTLMFYFLFTKMDLPGNGEHDIWEDIVGSRVLHGHFCITCYAGPHIWQRCKQRNVTVHYIKTREKKINLPNKMGGRIFFFQFYICTSKQYLFWNKTFTKFTWIWAD